MGERAAGRLMTRSTMMVVWCLVFHVVKEAGAGERHAEMAVSATVVARTLVDGESSPQQVNVSVEDVVRGYVEVRGATQLIVTNTNRRGFVLGVWPKVRMFSSVRVQNGENRAELGAEGGEIFERGWGQKFSVALDFRFVLAPGVLPGIYPWPIGLQVSPLTY